MNKPAFLFLLVFFTTLFLISCGEHKTKDIQYSEQFAFSPPTYVCYKTSGTITIDGKLSPEEWDAIPWSTDFLDIEGNSKPQPYHQTRVKMAHDEKGIYFGALLEEPHVWATITEHDAVIYHDNDFEIFIDPSNNTHNYMEYEVNALGTVWDLYLSKPYRDNPIVHNNWEFMGMKSAVHVHGSLNNPNDTDEYWSIEVFIPWSDIYQGVRRDNGPADGEQIRVNFSRVQWNTDYSDGTYKKIPMPGEEKIREHNWVWAPTGVINIHKPEYWGFVQFTDQQAGKNDVQFVWNKEEDIKWLLRELYYRQSEYLHTFGTYASNISDLKPEELTEEKNISNLAVYTTPSFYEITYQMKDGGSLWHIRQDGLVWKSK